MAAVIHLLRHDLRTHRAEIVVWLALVTVQVPLGFALADGLGPVHPEVATPLLLIVRLALAAIITASILQADAPSDDRTFWRTRPIPRGSMTSAKIGLIVVLLLGVPLTILLVEAVWLRVPLSHVPTILFDVLARDGAVVGLMLLVASLTRRVASMVLALAATGTALFMLLAMAGSVLRSSQVRAVFPGAPQYAEELLPALGVILAATTFVMTVYTWQRTARVRPLALLAATGLAAALAVISMPPLHAESERARVEAGRAEVVGRTVLATDATRAVFVSARLLLDGLSTQAGGTLRLVDGILDVEGRRYVLDDTPHEFRPGEPFLTLARLSRERFGEIAGRRARLTGTVFGDLEQVESLGRLPLRPGATLVADGVRLEVLDAGTTGTPSLGRLGVTWTRRHRADFNSMRTRLLLHPTVNGKAYGLPVTPSSVTALDTVMLPTFATPFGYRSVLVDDSFIPDAPSAGVGAWLEVVGPHSYSRGEWRLDTEVMVPAAPWP